MKTQWPLDVSLSFDPYYGEPARDGETGCEVLPDGKVRFSIPAPKAQEVLIDRFGTVFPLAKREDGIWEGTFDMGTGFLYFFLKIFIMPLLRFQKSVVKIIFTAYNI